jgi:hypothetical protein
MTARTSFQSESFIVDWVAHEQPVVLWYVEKMVVRSLLTLVADKNHQSNQKFHSGFGLYTNAL